MKKHTCMLVRDALKQNSVAIWELADALGIHENTLFRRLRYELPIPEQAHLVQVIERIAKERMG